MSRGASRYSQVDYLEAASGDAMSVAAMGKLLRQRRLELGLSQEYVAHEVGLSQNQISRVERGIIEHLPDPGVLAPWARVLHMDILELLTAAGYPVEDRYDPDSSPVSIETLHGLVDRMDDLPPRARRAIHDVIDLAAELNEGSQDASTRKRDSESH